MKIAQVSPLYESVPPKLYGGTERVVAYLTEELIRQGHEVTLFASGDSITNARLVAACDRALRLDENVKDSLAHHFVQLEQVFEEAENFDIVHFHAGYLHFPLFLRQTTPFVTTLHGRLDLGDLVPLYRRYKDVPLVSISDHQRMPLEWANWQGTVYHGLPTDLLTPGSGSGDYLAFIGRISVEKRVDRAIEIAQRAGMKLKIAAKIDAADREYYHDNVEHLLDDPLVECIGEVDDAGKQDLLGGAYALLFPIDWPEPFGLVIIEAMACGTPVIAFRRGSVPELIEDGVTGFIVDDIDEAVAALAKIKDFDRRRCREVFEERFSAPRMTSDYLKLFARMIEERPRPRRISDSIAMMGG